MSAMKLIAALALVLLLGCGGSSGTRTATPSQPAAPEPAPATPKGNMELTSPAFANGQPIPRQFTGEGENTSPQLDWTGVPDSTKAFALICSDPDAPSGTFTHWVVFNIPADARRLDQGIPAGALALPNGAAQGLNSAGRVGYMGPMPPPGKPHRYFFRLYVLDDALALDKPGARQVEAAIQGHVLATAELLGTYQRIP